MTAMPDFGSVPTPRHPPGEFPAHDAEARTILAPLFDALLDRLAEAGWDRRTVASALMFHAAAQVAASNGARQ